MVKRPCRVPQGSVLGRILFNMQVSDMPPIVNSLIFQFPDDLKLFRTVRSVEDFYQLLHDVNNYAFCLVQEMAVEVQY